MKVISQSFTALFFALAFTTTLAKADGFHVRGSELIDANGVPFLIRGINYPHAWYSKRAETSIKDIAATKANLVRVVLSAGRQPGKTPVHEVKSVIELAKQNNMIVMLEVHDTTGYGKVEDAMHLTETIPYWLGLREALEGQEAYVLINFGNEPTSHNVTAASYVEMNIDVIKALRAAGLTHTFVADAHGWGQDSAGAMRDHASTIFAADPLKNTIFSVHMYEHYAKAETINSYLRAFKASDLVLIVGEFGPDHLGKPVDEDAILQAAREMSVGYIAWSWSGNSEKAKNLDLVLEFDPERLSPWGQRLIEGADGLRATSVPATVFQ
jgi:mannan endo-1,4-beta-mannosidase